MPMTKKEFDKLEEGDLLHVAVRVYRTEYLREDGSIDVELQCGAGSLGVRPDDVVCRIAGRPLKVGDVVSHSAVGSGYLYTIIGLDGGTAWIKDKGDEYLSCAKTYLILCPPNQK